MSRRALTAFAAVFAAGLAALVITAQLERKSEAFTLGVLPSAGIERLVQGDELCQRPIDVIDSFDRVKLQLGTFARPGSPFVLEVRAGDAGRGSVRARVAGGYRDNMVHTVTLPRAVPEGSSVAVCVRNAGSRPIAPYGNSGASNPTSAAYENGRPLDSDMTLVFLREEPATVLSLVPSIVERASLFHGDWGSRPAYWVLLVLLLVGPASLVALAARAAFRDET